MKIYFILIFFALFFLDSTKLVFAIPPPDFLFNVGSQVVQIFSILIIFLSALLAGVRQFAKTYFIQLKYKKTVWIFLALVVIGISFVGADYYQQYKQEQEYAKWIAESEQANAEFTYGDYDTDKLRIGAENIIQNGEKIITDEVAEEIVDIEKVQKKDSILRYDDNMRFIQRYYKYLNDGEIESAYEVSKKSVSLNTYKSWYQNVESAALGDIQKISNDKYSLQISLVENGETTVYAVLMTIDMSDPDNLRIADSEVRVLDTADDGESVVVPIIENVQIVDSANFFAANKDIPLVIDNPEFKSVVDSDSNIFILDAREDEEFEIGYFPGSTHIRFADLIAGQWVGLPADKVVYVFCWSGIRGEEVARFLREKQILARYVKAGADGWVSYGGTWIGGIKFLVAHPEKRFSLLFSTDDVKRKIEEGVVIVDSRIYDKYNEWHIPGSINIPVIYTTSSEMNNILAQVPAESSVITVCDDFVSCFDAKLTGLKLERLGNEFLGRYNKPWEYRNNM